MSIVGNRGIWFAALLAIASPGSANTDRAEGLLFQCAMAKVREYAAKSQETAPVVVEAALGSCSAADAEFLEQIYANFALGREDAAQAAYEDRLDFLRRQLLAVAVESRARP